MDGGELHLGRPYYGGCGIIYHKSLAPIISRFNCCSDLIVSLLSTYLYQTLILTAHNNPQFLLTFTSPDSNAAFLECLGELDGFISAQPYDNLIICGDFNVDFLVALVILFTF